MGSTISNFEMARVQKAFVFAALFLFASVSFAAAPIELNSCSDSWVWLYAENTTYVLTQDISSDGFCFKISARNVTLDGNGHTITYSQSQFGDPIFAGHSDGLTIKNLNLVQADPVSETYSVAIHLEATANSSIFNNHITIYGDHGHGIYLDSSNSNNITNNRITTHGRESDGIFVSAESASNVISYNDLTILDESSRGIRFGDSGSYILQSLSAGRVSSPTSPGGAIENITYRESITVKKLDKMQAQYANGNTVTANSNNTNGYNETVMEMAEYGWLEYNLTFDKQVETQSLVDNAAEITFLGRRYIVAYGTVTGNNTVNTLALTGNGGLHTITVGEEIEFSGIKVKLTNVILDPPYGVVFELTSLNGTVETNYTPVGSIATVDGRYIQVLRVGEETFTDLNITAPIAKLVFGDKPDIFRDYDYYPAGTTDWLVRIIPGDTNGFLKGISMIYTLSLINKGALAVGQENSFINGLVKVTYLGQKIGVTEPLTITASTLDVDTRGSTADQVAIIKFPGELANIPANMNPGKMDELYLVLEADDTFSAGQVVYRNTSGYPAFENYTNATTAFNLLLGSAVYTLNSTHSSLMVTEPSNGTWYANVSTIAVNFDTTQFSPKVKNITISPIVANSGGKVAWLEEYNWFKFKEGFVDSYGTSLNSASQHEVSFNLPSEESLTELKVESGYGNGGIILYGTLGSNQNRFLRFNPPEVTLSAPVGEYGNTLSNNVIRNMPLANITYDVSNSTGCSGNVSFSIITADNETLDLSSGNSALISSGLSILRLADLLSGVSIDLPINLTGFLSFSPVFQEEDANVSSAPEYAVPLLLQTISPNLALFGNANVSFNYSLFNISGSDIYRLRVYKCADYNASARNCSGPWVELNSTIDNTTQVITATTGSFSTFMLSNSTQVCGNYLTEGSEQCDDGPSGSSTCSSACTSITPPPSGGSSPSGGGGGGGGAPAPSSAKSATASISAISMKVSVTLKSAVSGPSLKAVLLQSAPVAAPVQPVYQYLNFTKSKFNDSNIESAVVEFRVNKSWLAENDISSVYLARYEDGWNELRTELVGSTDGYNSYKAYTNAFSYFAIIGEKAVLPANSVETEISFNNTIEQPSLIESNGTTNTSVAVASAQTGFAVLGGGLSGTTLFFAAIILIFGVAMHSRRPKPAAQAPNEQPKAVPPVQPAENVPF